MIYQVVKVISEFPTGIIGDKYGRKISVIYGIFGLTFFYVITSYSNNYYLLAVAMGFSAIGYSCISGSLDSLIIEKVIANKGKESLQKFGALQRVIFFSAIGLSNLVGGYVAEISYNLFLYISIAIHIIALFSINLVTEDLQPENTSDNNEKFTMKGIFHYLKDHKTLYPFIGLTLGISILMIPVDTYMNSFLFRYGLSEIQIGWAMFAIFFLSSLFGLFSSKISLKLDSNLVMSIFPILIIIFTLFFINSTNIVISIFLYFLAMVIFSLYAPVRHKDYNSIIENKYRATVLSFQSFIMAFFSIFTHIIFGYLSDLMGIKNSLNILGLISIVFLLPCLVYFLRKRKKSISELETRSKVS